MPLYFPNNSSQNHTNFFFEQKKKISGFTLLELMICLAIIGILLGFGTHSFQVLQRKNYRQEIADIFMEAKAQSVFAGKRVVMEISSDQLRLQVNKEEESVLEFDSSFRITAINNQEIAQNFYSISINRLGITEDLLLYCTDNQQEKSLYLPSIGTVILLDNFVSYETLYKEIL